MQECVNITYTNVYLGRLFGFRYQHQVIETVIFRMVWIILPDWFTPVSEPLNIASQKPTFHKKLSLAWCQLFDVNYAVHSCNGGYVKIQTRGYYC